MNYIDIHCHLVPGVDDGSANEDESRSMLRQAAEDGTKKMIVTPHFRMGSRHQKDRETVETQFEKLKQIRDEICPEVELYLGNELYGQEGISDSLPELAHTMAGSKYVLIEFGINIVYVRMKKILQKLIYEGYYPIVAHVERYECLWKHYERLDELIQIGCYLQMNADSVVGGMFNREAAYCKKLVKEGYITFLGSDAHDKVDRRPILSEGYKSLAKVCDEGQLERLFGGHAQMVLDNKCI